MERLQWRAARIESRPVARMSSLGSRLATLPGVLWVLGVVLAVFMGIGSLTWPLGNDQAFFTFIANAVLDGGVPYRDAWELKGPLTFYVYAIEVAVFGHHEVGIRIFDLVIVLLFCARLRALVFRINGQQALGANFAALFFFLAYICSGLWETAQPDEWGGMLVFVAVSMLVTSTWHRNWSVIGSGIIIAIATLLKPTFLIFLVLPLLYPAVEGDSRAYNLAPRALCLLSYVSTIAVTLLIVFCRGGLRDYVDVLHFLSSSYVPFDKRFLPGEILALPGNLFNLGLLIPYLLVLPGIWFAWQNNQRRDGMILLTWFALAVLMVIIQGTYWPYTYFSATIAVAVILGNALSIFDLPAFVPGGRHLAAGIAALVTGLSVLAPFSSDPLSSDTLFQSLEWPGFILGRQGRTQYVDELLPTLHYSQLDEMAAYIESHSNRAERVFLWGWEIRILVKAHRRSPTRFGSFEALITEGPLQSKYRQIFMRDISNVPPRYIVVDCLPSFYRPEKSGLTLLHDFPEFWRFLHGRYRLACRIGQYQMWTLT